MIGPPVAAAAGDKPPERWSELGPMVQLRITERWWDRQGDPFTWWDGLDPGRQAVLLTYEKWRRRAEG